MFLSATIDISIPCNQLSSSSPLPFVRDFKLVNISSPTRRNWQPPREGVDLTPGAHLIHLNASLLYSLFGGTVFLVETVLIFSEETGTSSGAQLFFFFLTCIYWLLTVVQIEYKTENEITLFDSF